MSGEDSTPSPTTLRNGNPRRDPTTLPRCGARTRAGTPCRQPAMRNGRCRLHGGLSTGARTEAGKAAQRESHVKSDTYGATGRALDEAVRDLVWVGRLMARGESPPPGCRTIGDWVRAVRAARRSAPPPPRRRTMPRPPARSSPRPAGPRRGETACPPVPRAAFPVSSIVPRPRIAPDCTHPGRGWRVPRSAPRPPPPAP
ncbi:MAG: HGGxSTG domain-containing protein [Acetobacteraceae bacterium]